MHKYGLTAFVLAAACCNAAAADTDPHIDTSGVNMQPAYPATALPTGERGAVVLSVDVDPSGRVAAIRPVLSSGFSDLDSAAIMGVMGWHFIPATKDGKNIAGTKALQIVFQPPGETTPAAPKDAAASDGAMPKPKAEFLPSSIELNEPRGQFDENIKQLPCPYGRIQATIQFLHPNGGAEGSKWAASAWIRLQTETKGAVALYLTAQENYLNAPEAFSLAEFDTKNLIAEKSFSYVTHLGVPATVVLSWDPTGMIKGSVGNMNTQEFRLLPQPTQLVFAA